MARPNKNPDLIRIVAIDPATSAMGISVLDYNKSTLHTTVQRSMTVYGDKILKDPMLLEMSRIFDRQFSILSGIHYYVLNNIFKVYKPQYIVVESAFCNRLFVTAYGTLLLVINEIRKAAQKYYNQDIYQLAPKFIKKEITLHHDAKKDDIKLAILTRSELKVAFNEKYITIDKMTHHEFDAVAHGLAFIRTILPNILITQQIPI